MKVIIAGSRDILDYNIVRSGIEESINKLGMSITEVVSGCANGVDSLGEKYAREHGIPIKKFPADWDKQGKSAGIIRNLQMADYADAVIAITNGSRGTAHMIRTAQSRGMPINIISVAKTDQGSDILKVSQKLDEIEKGLVDNTQILRAEIETRKHIDEVRLRLFRLAGNLIKRGMVHDKSKLESPEAEIFAEYTAKLKNVTYGSEEYNQFLKEMKPALDHHYANNSHHPEHFPDGINDMSLVDLLEMIVDWYAATLRHEDGDISKSIEKNKKRFGISDQLAKILKNTIKDIK